MGIFVDLCEQLRNAVDDQGAKECYRQSVEAYAKKTGLPEEGLWAAVDGALQGYKPGKILRRLNKSWGGTPEVWGKWYAMVQSMRGCE